MNGDIYNVFLHIRKNAAFLFVQTFWVTTVLNIFYY